MTNPFPRAPTSEHNELLLVLGYLLPVRNCWFHYGQLAKVLADGGICNLPPRFITNSLKSKRASDMFFAFDRYLDKKWYCFDPNKMKYASLRDQTGFLQGTTLEEEREAVVSSISPGFFRSFEFKYLSKYVDGSGPPDEFPRLSPEERACRESLLRQRFQKDRVIVREIPGDGACLFRSIADQIYRVHGTALHLHFCRLVCDWIAKNRDAIAGFCADYDPSIDEVLDT